MGEGWMDQAATKTPRQRREENLRKHQREYACTLATVGTEGSGPNGFKGGKKLLTRLGERAFKEDTDQKHEEDMKMATEAITRFEEALLYYPEWEELHLMRAEALRTRSLLYKNVHG